ncbi:MAG: hypothetical protein ACI9G1_000596 [Pirellulaceae bacterium]|jgi:hypothetical protein
MLVWRMLVWRMLVWRMLVACTQGESHKIGQIENLSRSVVALFAYNLRANTSLPKDRFRYNKISRKDIWQLM